MTIVDTSGTDATGASDVAADDAERAPGRRPSRVVVVVAVAVVLVASVAGGLLVRSAGERGNGGGPSGFVPETSGWRPIETTAADEGAGIVAKGDHRSSRASYSLRRVPGELQEGTDLDEVAEATSRALAGSVARYEPGRHAVEEVGGTPVIRLEYGQAAGPADGASAVVMIVIPSEGSTVYLTVRGDRDGFPDVDGLVEEVVAEFGATD